MFGRGWPGLNYTKIFWGELDLGTPLILGVFYASFITFITGTNSLEGLNREISPKCGTTYNKYGM